MSVECKKKAPVSGLFLFGDDNFDGLGSNIR